MIVYQFFRTKSKQIQHEGIELIGFIEFSHNSIIYRTSFFYKNELPWYDWALVAWFISHKYTKPQIQDETFPEIIDVLNMKETTTLSDKKAMLTPTKLMAFI